MSQNGPPSLIEPIFGTIVLRNLQGISGVTVAAHDGSGRPPMGEPIGATKNSSRLGVFYRRSGYPVVSHLTVALTLYAFARQAPAAPTGYAEAQSCVACHQ